MAKLVDAHPDAPSWTHYEYLFFFNMLQETYNRDGLFPMLVMAPEEGTDTHADIRAAALRVFAGKPQVEIERDRAAQQEFLRTIREGGNFLRHAVLERLKTLELSHDTSSRLVQTFHDASDLRHKVSAYLQLHELRRKTDRIEELEAELRAPPEPPDLPDLSGRDVERLKQAGTASAICVVTQPSEAVTATAVAKALVAANPFEVEGMDAFVEFSAERFDPDTTSAEILERFRQTLGDVLQFRAEPGEEFFESLGRWIVQYETTLMVRFAAPVLAQFNLTDFCHELWQPLEKAIISAQEFLRQWRSGCL